MFVISGCKVQVMLSKSVLVDAVVYFDYMMLLVSMWYGFLFRASLRVSVYE